MDTLPQPDWSQYPDAERDDATLSGAWRLRGTRIRVQDVMDNAVDQTPEEIAGEVYPSLSIDRVRGVLGFAAKGIVSISTTHWPTVRANLPALTEAVESASPGTYRSVQLPRPPP